jgi:effector-binding domain-containing protein
MIDVPQIVRTAAQHTAIIHFTIPRNEIQNVMGPGLSELMATVAAQGVSPAGPWFAHHLRMDPNTYDFEISLPVLSPIAPFGRVQPSQSPATTVARTIYHGGYEGLASAWGEFDAWIIAEGHTPGPDLWECYVAGPESNPDPPTFRTELSRPLSDLGA